MGRARCSCEVKLELNTKECAPFLECQQPF